MSIHKTLSAKDTLHMLWYLEEHLLLEIKAVNLAPFIRLICKK